MLIQAQPPHRRTSALYMFAFTPVSFFFSPDVTLCVCCMNTAQRLVCEVTDSFITGLCARGDSSIHAKERGGQRRGTGRVYCWGPCQFSRQQVGGVRQYRTVAVSFNEHSLLSSAFNLQAHPALLPIHACIPERLHVIAKTKSQ